jgi:hypothetical protein
MRSRSLQQRPLDVGFSSGGRNGMDLPGFRVRFVHTAVADAWICQRDDPLDATGGGEDLPVVGCATGCADRAETDRVSWENPRRCRDEPVAVGEMEAFITAAG